MKIGYNSIKKAKKLIDEYCELREKLDVLKVPCEHKSAYVVVKTHYRDSEKDMQIELPLPTDDTWQKMRDNVIKRMKEIEEELAEL